MNFRSTTLQNGLTIIAEVDPAAHTAAAGFFVKTGARDEATPLMGVSHFLEHMMFKGTADLSAEDLNRKFDEIGAKNNAYTSNEMTCFYAQVLPEHMRTGVDLLGRMMRPALRQSDFDTEKGVILEEIAMYKDKPFWVLYERAIEVHYGKHPMSHRVLGTDDTIKALARDQMEGYFTHRYSADNTVVSLAGNLDFEACVDQIRALCGHWPRTGAVRSPIVPVPVGGTFEVRDPKVNRGYYIGIAKGPTGQDDRRYAASLLAQVLGASENSRLHWALIETGMAEEAMAAYDGHDGVGEYYLYASADPERLGEVEAEINRQIEGLVESITEDDLERLRNRIATAATLGAERPGDRMQRLGRHWMLHGSYVTLDEELAKINAVTRGDLVEVARAFPIGPMTVGRMLPGG
jgi:predicted Zn-dependent peptidase